MAKYVSENSKANEHALLAFCIYTGGPAPVVMVWRAIRYTEKTSLAWTDDNLNANWCVSDILFTVFVPRLCGQHNVTFDQDNAKPPIARYVLKTFDIQDIRLLP